MQASRLQGRFCEAGVEAASTKQCYCLVFLLTPCITPGRRHSKTPTLSRNVDKKSIETVFSIAICRLTGDKWQSKTLFLSIFDLRSWIVDYVFDCRLPGVLHAG